MHFCICPPLHPTPRSIFREVRGTEQEDEEHLKRLDGCVISIKEVSSSIVRPSISPPPPPTSTPTLKGWNESKTRQLRLDFEISLLGLTDFVFVS